MKKDYSEYKPSSYELYDIRRRPGKDLDLEVFRNHAMLFCFTSPQIVNIAEKMSKKETSTKEVLQAGFLSSLEELTEEEQSWLEAHREFVEENEVEIIVNIYRLKHSKDYSELGDYYMALRYFFGVTSTSVSDEMARAFGNELMLNLRLLDNPYAKKFCNDQE